MQRIAGNRLRSGPYQLDVGTYVLDLVMGLVDRVDLVMHLGNVWKCTCNNR